MIDVTKFVETLGGKPVAVFGLGLSGLSSVAALRGSGANVIAWDDRSEPRKKAEKAGAKIEQFTPDILAKCGALVLAPGVPLTHPAPHPVVRMAVDLNLEILCDIEILHRAQHGRKTIGITGTNGKSTSVALMDHVLKQAGHKTVLAGNIGTPVLTTKMPPKDGCYVLELSSYQLDLCTDFAPDIAVLLNITPDHLDRHGNIENYAAAKERVFRAQGSQDSWGVIGIDNEYCRDMYERLKGSSARRMVPISVTQCAEGGVYVADGALIDDLDGEAVEMGKLSNITILHGRHNHQNAAAVYAALRLYGLAGEDIFKGFKSYPGLPHRQFPVAVKDGVVYMNDSKATNAEAASKALVAHKKIYWIAGGRAKEGGLEGLDPYMPNIKHAFLIGEAASDFAVWLEARGVPHTISYNLEKATKAAHDLAHEQRGQPGGAGVILLSPACASWDQFDSFEQRGDEFTAQVKALVGSA